MEPEEPSEGHPAMVRLLAGRAAPRSSVQALRNASTDCPLRTPKEHIARDCACSPAVSADCFFPRRPDRNSAAAHISRESDKDYASPAPDSRASALRWSNLLFRSVP